MFIPIDAKADVSVSKKGKLTPAQHAQINAWTLANKTGIFDCLGKCEYDVAHTSLVPSNNEVSIVFHNGYIAICGRIVECEEGTTLTLTTPTVGTETGWIVARYSLGSSGINEFEVVQKKTTEGDLIQQDLNDSPSTGVYEFVLYSYTATTSSVTLERTNTDYIPAVSEKIITKEIQVQDTTSGGIPSAKLLIGDDAYFCDTDVEGTICLYKIIKGSLITEKASLEANLEGKATEADYASSDHTKGTIEQRLTNLGFRQDAVSLSSSFTASTNLLRRQGNYVLGDIVFNIPYNIAGQGTGYTTNIYMGSIPEKFRPAHTRTFNFPIYASIAAGGELKYMKFNVIIQQDGNIYLNMDNIFRVYSSNNYILNFGYEANPIT